MNQETVTIDFSNFGGPVYSGRDRGELARREKRMGDLDSSDGVIEVNISDATYAVTSSFFLGLFGPSIKKCGNRDAFLAKFQFDIPEPFKPMLESCIERALRGNTELLQ